MALVKSGTVSDKPTGTSPCVGLGCTSARVLQLSSVINLKLWTKDKVVGMSPCRPMTTLFGPFSYHIHTIFEHF